MHSYIHRYRKDFNTINLLKSNLNITCNVIIVKVKNYFIHDHLLLDIPQCKTITLSMYYNYFLKDLVKKILKFYGN